MHLGRDRVIAAHEVRGELIVDPGAASTLETLIDGLSGEPRAILLTHIHLDHASATGALVRRWPDLRVYVSEVGAPHVVEPKKLLASAGRLYGAENMDRLWGEVLPVPAGQRRRARGWGGGRGIPGRARPRPRRPPPRLARPRRGRRLRRRHGRRPDPAGRFHRSPRRRRRRSTSRRGCDSLDADRGAAPAAPAADPLRRRRGRRAPSSSAPARACACRREAAGAAIASVSWLLEARSTPAPTARRARSLRQAIPPDQAWQGLERYWRKRREAEQAA